MPTPPTAPGYHHSSNASQRADRRSRAERRAARQHPFVELLRARSRARRRAEARAMTSRPTSPTPVEPASRPTLDDSPPTLEDRFGPDVPRERPRPLEERLAETDPLADTRPVPGEEVPHLLAVQALLRRETNSNRAAIVDLTAMIRELTLTSQANQAHFAEQSARLAGLEDRIDVRLRHALGPPVPDEGGGGPAPTSRHSSAAGEQPSGARTPPQTQSNPEDPRRQAPRAATAPASTAQWGPLLERKKALDRTTEPPPETRGRTATSPPQTRPGRIPYHKYEEAKREAEEEASAERERTDREIEHLRNSAPSSRTAAQQEPTWQVPKVSDMPKFSGEPTAVLAWLAKMEVFLSPRAPSGYTQTILLQRLPLLMQGRAEAWWEASSASTRDLWSSDWSAFREAIQEAFLPDRDQLREWVQSRKWDTSSETLETYVLEKKRMLRACHPELPEDFVASQIEDGFPPALRVWMRTLRNGAGPSRKSSASRPDPVQQLLLDARAAVNMWSHFEAGMKDPAKAPTQKQGTLSGHLPMTTRPAATAALADAGPEAFSAQAPAPQRQSERETPSRVTPPFVAARMTEFERTYDPSRIFFEEGQRKYRVPFKDRVLTLKRPCGTCGRDDHFSFEHIHLNQKGVLQPPLRPPVAHLAASTSGDWFDVAPNWDEDGPVSGEGATGKS